MNTHRLQRRSNAIRQKDIKSKRKEKKRKKVRTKNLSGRNKKSADYRSKGINSFIKYRYIYVIL